MRNASFLAFGWYPFSLLLCHSCRAVDEMGHRIDELENSIGELMAQAGIDEEPTADGAAPPARSAATPGLRDPLV